ncbi:MerR family transcriptional regulator [Streptomyces niveiscabiei]|uniref:MerR family transcriptional regulator n=1 Tax=Streptomyces niveiscabiei TaxID=164115 RepID=UPI003EB6B55D
MPRPALTTGALARRLGIAPTTLRTWDHRYGIGPTTRPTGTHRRWTPADVAVVERMCRLTSTGTPPAEAARLAIGERNLEAGRTTVEEQTPDAGRVPARAQPSEAGRVPGEGQIPEADQVLTEGRGKAARVPQAVVEKRDAQPIRAGLDACGAADAALRAVGDGDAAVPEPTPALPLGDLRHGLARAALRLDSPALERQLAVVVDACGVTRAWEEVIAPVLHAVGRKWASSGERYVEVEHLLSWHVSTALRRHTRPAVGADPVVLACVPGEQHTLALEALHAALGERALPVRMFGAALPVPALAAAVSRLGPSVVVLWAQTRSTADPALTRRIARTRWGVRGARRGPLVVLAGPGWLGRVGDGMLWPGSLRDAVDAVSRGRGPV